MVEETTKGGLKSRLIRYAIIGTFMGFGLCVSNGIGVGNIAKTFGNYVNTRVEAKTEKINSEKPPGLEDSIKKMSEATPEQRRQAMATLTPEERGELMAWYSLEATNDKSFTAQAHYTLMLMHRNSYKTKKGGK